MARSKQTHRRITKINPNAHLIPRMVTSTVWPSQVLSENEADISSAESGTSDSENEASGSNTQEADVNDLEWAYNEGLKQVLHDVDDCDTCREFAVHYCNSKIRLHPSYHRAISAREKAIAGDVQERIDRRRSQMEEFNKVIPDLQQKLEGVRREMKMARFGLASHRMRLEEVRGQLEEARRDRRDQRDRAAASGSCTAKSSRRPRLSQSPSPRPRKSQRLESS
jgi:chromosome segregation ATPase